MAFSSPSFLSIDAVGSELLVRLLEHIDCDTHQRTPKNSSIKLSNIAVFDLLGVCYVRVLDLLWALSPLVASVGPETLRVLREYISGDTPESVFDNSFGKPR